MAYAHMHPKDRENTATPNITSLRSAYHPGDAIFWKSTPKILNLFKDIKNSQFYMSLKGTQTSDTEICRLIVVQSKWKKQAIHHSK